MKFSRLMLFTAAVAVMVTTSSCTKKQNELNVKDSESKYGNTYPIQTDETLTMWANFSLDPKYKKFEEQPLYQELYKRTGIKVEYMIPTGDAKEQFNLLIASGDYPDIIAYNWYDCVGSPSKALAEKIIIPLNDIIKAYAPNANKLFEENQSIKHYISDGGEYYSFPSFVEDNSQMVYSGPIIRSDLLDKFNLTAPETIEEWEKVLRIFKNNGIKSPLTILGKTLSSELTNTFIFGSFNTAYKYYVKNDGSITYGPVEPEFRGAIELLRSWYQEGLLDAEFASADDDLVQKKITDGSAGATVHYVSRIARWNNASSGEAKFAGIAYPALEKGKPAEFSQLDTMGKGLSAAITTSCDNLELAAKYLDYGYSDEGILLFNYGIEGETYTMDSGNAMFKSEYLNDFDRLNPFTCLHLTMHEVNRFNQRNQMKEQQDAIKSWTTDMSKHLIPAITPTTEEAETIVALTNSINTYSDEMILKFIVGYESMDKYDSFVNQLKALGVDTVIKTQQAQLERFNNRVGGQ